jgi:protein involved in polysaccharide export with SLBB domain
MDFAVALLEGGTRMRNQTRAVTRAMGYVWLLFLATVAGAQPETASVVRYEVQPSDLLQVSVWKEPDLTQQVVVRPDGAFSFPLVGEVNAVGKTVEELRRELVQQLTRIIPDVVVTVSVLEIRGNKVCDGASPDRRATSI